MRILSTTLAIDAKGHIVTATDAAKAKSSSYRCHQCDCPVILNDGGGFLNPWFEHNQQAYPTEKLQQCPYYDPEGKESARTQKLRQLVRGLSPVVSVLNWHCNQCNSDYVGEKHCIACNTGIYSIEAKSPT